jgi:hypothetical protein
MRRRSPPQLGVVLAIPLLLAGGCITDSCGCSPLPPPRASTVVTGVVRGENGSPISGALVRLDLAWDPSCSGTVSSPSVRVQTDARGQFDQPVYWLEGDQCLRIFVERAQWFPGMVSDTHEIGIDWDGETEITTPDSVNVTLRLRPRLP